MKWERGTALSIPIPRLTSIQSYITRNGILHNAKFPIVPYSLTICNMYIQTKLCSTIEMFSIRLVCYPFLCIAYIPPPGLHSARFLFRSSSVDLAAMTAIQFHIDTTNWFVLSLFGVSAGTEAEPIQIRRTFFLSDLGTDVYAAVIQLGIILDICVCAAALL